MRLQGIDAYVLPTEYLAQPQKYMPYLFTDDELIRFSQVIDTIPHTGNGSFEDYTLPVFFRIAYGCGLRPNELFNLRRYDVHFDDKYIFVYFSKTKRDRVVPLSCQNPVGGCERSANKSCQSTLRVTCPFEGLRAKHR